MAAIRPIWTILEEAHSDWPVTLAAASTVTKKMQTLARLICTTAARKLAQAVREYGLPLDLLRDLIDAFTQDVTKRRYATYAELLDYSRRSANP